MSRLFFQYCAETKLKVCSFDTMLAKLGLNLCQKLNKPSKDCQRVLKFCQSGEISPNLVTLKARDNCLN